MGQGSKGVIEVADFRSDMSVDLVQDFVALRIDIIEGRRGHRLAAAYGYSFTTKERQSASKVVDCRLDFAPLFLREFRHVLRLSEILNRLAVMEGEKITGGG